MGPIRRLPPRMQVRNCGVCMKASVVVAVLDVVVVVSFTQREAASQFLLNSKTVRCTVCFIHFLLTTDHAHHLLGCFLSVCTYEILSIDWCLVRSFDHESIMQKHSFRFTPLFARLQNTYTSLQYYLQIFRVFICAKRTWSIIVDELTINDRGK